ncbi:Asp23/Gls24 family envelope stress response protein [Mycolicibacterium sp. 050158]|uniref:Asp23/Gls24 family envelope stress response protein n=1 Tax=Mycolicibacterium sp. 050158 TaxID=3090602 RepID=UPI00299DED34|nr:Asp23/Gls24 family envelope stress response protein [Mycolicibacterium sp. 050158]MDX1890722.1 Asp23/Gls24 family envelope stress response protein [Mycolicibacterium sp. 050158]
MASQPPVDGAEPVDPGERGSLVVRDKVAQRVAVHAALATPGVRARAAGLDKLTGRDLPRARVDVSATRVRAHLSIAVVWPASLAAVGIAVQRNVTRALTDSAGFQVDGVDVSIEAVVSDDEHGRNLS